MSLRDSDALVVEADVAFSLPDPTTVTGRKHLLSNTSTAAIVVSSTGATPFATGGVNTATITLGVGQSIIYQSDGARWTARSSGSRAFFAATGVTDASGNVTFAFPAGLFAAAPVVTASVQNVASNEFFDQRITAVSATSVTLNLKATTAISVALLGLTLLATPAAVSGRTIHVIATPAGATP